MRNKINVLWLDDDLGPSAQKLVNLLENSLIKKGYSLKLLKYNDFSIAQDAFNDPKIKIDFFISDFNLGEKDGAEITGFDFLLELRKNNHDKEFLLLYSNYDLPTIQHSILENLKSENSNIRYISNFYYLSLGNNEEIKKKEIEKCISLALCRWDELNAIRGEYAFACSTIEFITKKILSIVKNNNRYLTDCRFRDHYGAETDLINHASPNFDTTYICSLEAEWNNIREIRNDLEHNPENFDDSIYEYKIIGKHTAYLESDVEIYRKKLVDFLIKYKKFVESLCASDNRLESILADPLYLSI